MVADMPQVGSHPTFPIHKPQREKTRMNIQWSDNIPRLLLLSRQVANDWAKTEVDASCLLVAIIHKGDNAADILRQMGIDPVGDTAAIALKETGRPGYALKDNDEFYGDTQVNINFSVDGQRLLRIANLEARHLGENAVAPIHLLLSMLHDKDNAARTYLNGKGITYNRVIECLNIRPGVRAAYGMTDEESLPPGSGKGNGDAVTGAQNAAPGESDTPMLDRFGVDLTAKAADGLLDPVVGRQKEIERMTQILCRRKKNNPILIGQPGAGKSAVVEGLAGLIASRKAPHVLLDKRIMALDMASVVAGTQYRGQFEERLRKLIEELRDHKEIILFIDEIHTMIGAGSAAGTLDAANILKPALARGEVQCIGATTIDEYRKTIEKDGALERRFQKILIEPSSAEEALDILRNLRSRYEEHHGVTYTDKAIEACVTLTQRYVTDRCLPDKAIDAMDEAGSKVHLANVVVPQCIIDKEQEIEALKVQKTRAAQNQDYELAARLRDALGTLTTELEQLKKDNEGAFKTQAVVDEDVVAEVVSMMCGVPAGKMKQGETERLGRMKQTLMERVIAQDEAVEKLVRAITLSRLGIKGQDRPIGSFMFVGPTGVGKTHLVKCLAECLFDSKDALIRIDMSEYGEKYSTSRLVGAPPGYVGYEEGGQLTERVRRHPYSVILLDEIEKAHPDVFNTLLQVMDEGRMTDGNGTTVDFRNTVIIMTSNSGTRQLGEYGKGIGFNSAEQTAASVDGIIHKALKKQFAPEFLNRLDDIILFRPLDKTSAARIARLELDQLAVRLNAMGITLDINDALIDYLVAHGFDTTYGARSLKRAIKTHVEDALCDAMIGGTNLQGQTIRFEFENDKLVLHHQPA